MSFFLFYQQDGGEQAWETALADKRADLIASKRPRFVTVLDVDAPVDASFTLEQFSSLKYRGPLYADWDGDLLVVIPKVQEFIEKLREAEVDPDCVRWYATGGRGFHAEIPAHVFIEKPSPKGYTNLPAILKEMIFELYVDTLDLRVYSARRGRMWRTPGVQRENGLYKVPVTVAEIETITPELYEKICEAPRSVVVKAPVFSHKLAVMFAKAEQKILTSAKTKKNSDVDVKLLARFKGAMPPSLLRVGSGEAIKDGTGFHQIAMQVAITANAIGRSEADMLADCEGLIQNHVSDGWRYNTPGKRRAELIRMHRYTSGNPCYQYSKDAVRAICAPEADTSDLDGLSDAAGAEMAAGTEDDHGLLGSLSMRNNGIYCKDAEGIVKMICNVSFDDVYAIKTLPDNGAPSETWGFDAVVRVRGKDEGRKSIPVEVFSARAKFNTFAMKASGIMTGTDNQASATTQLLHQLAEKGNKVRYVVKREGLDLVTNPETGKLDLIWVGAGEVISAADSAPYVFRSNNKEGGMFRSSLAKCEGLKGSDEELEIFRALLTMNDPQPLAKLLGWMTSAFQRPIYTHLFQKFPILQIYGQAGSGKTETTLVLAHMHFEETKAIAPASLLQYTPFVAEALLTNSSSIPAILDEYKPAFFKAGHLPQFRGMFNSVYNAGYSSRGGGSAADGDKNFQTITQSALTAPTLFIAENVETTDSIMQRTVLVPMGHSGIQGRGAQFRIVSDNKWALSRLGRELLSATFAIPMGDDAEHPYQGFKEAVRNNMDKAKTILSHQTKERPIYNHAVVMTGFSLFRSVLETHFADKLAAELDAVEGTLTRQDQADITPAPMAEASTVIDMLAYISRNEDQYSVNLLKEGRDYTFSTQGTTPCIDLLLQECYVKLVAWAKQRGQPYFYLDFKSFEHGLRHYKPMIDALATDSALRNANPGPNVTVYRLSLAWLEAEQVQQFKGQ